MEIRWDCDEDNNGGGKFRSIPYSNNIMRKFVADRGEASSYPHTLCLWLGTAELVETTTSEII